MNLPKFFSKTNQNRLTIMFKMAATTILGSYIFLLIAVGPFTLRLRTQGELDKEDKKLEKTIIGLEKEKAALVKKIAKAKK